MKIRNTHKSRQWVIGLSPTSRSNPPDGKVRVVERVRCSNDWLANRRRTRVLALYDWRLASFLRAFLLQQPNVNAAITGRPRSRSR